MHPNAESRSVDRFDVGCQILVLTRYSRLIFAEKWPKKPKKNKHNIDAMFRLPLQGYNQFFQKRQGLAVPDTAGGPPSAEKCDGQDEMGCYQVKCNVNDNGCSISQCLPVHET